MPYRGGSLTDLLGSDTTEPPTRRMLRDVAEEVGDEWTDRAKQHTPTRTGNLARRWRSLPVEKTPEGYTSGTENPSPLAHLVEYGVAPHDLGEGERDGAQHPGHEGAHMLARSAHEIDATWPALAQPHLSRWARDVERRAKRHPGVV